RACLSLAPSARAASVGPRTRAIVPARCPPDRWPAPAGAAVPEAGPVEVVEPPASGAGPAAAGPGAVVAGAGAVVAGAGGAALLTGVGTAPASTRIFPTIQGWGRQW